MKTNTFLPLLIFIFFFRSRCMSPSEKALNDSITKLYSLYQEVNKPDRTFDCYYCHKNTTDVIFLHFAMKCFTGINNYFLPTYIDTVLIKPDKSGGFWLNITLLREYYPSIANQFLIDYRNELITKQEIITDQIRLYV